MQIKLQEYVLNYSVRRHYICLFFFCHDTLNKRNKFHSFLHVVMHFEKHVSQNEISCAFTHSHTGALMCSTFLLHEPRYNGLRKIAIIHE